MTEITEPGWREASEAALGGAIARLDTLGGGDFARSSRATLEDGRVVFVKTHDAPPPRFFSTEANGLRWLREAGAVAVPEVLFASDEPPCLVLEWIETRRGGTSAAAASGDRESAGRTPGGRTSSGVVRRAADEGEVVDREAAFGRALAALHGAGAPCYGREDGRTTGSLAVPNEPAPDWPTFYAERRLLPLARIAAERRSLPPDTIARLERVAGRLGEFGASEEAPSRLHGDLWAGNRMVDASGRSWLVDPAAHGGHREFDLAMMRLFGGFGERCHAAYREATPLAPGWESRVPLHQLAPLAVHAIKFGGSYARATREALDRLL